MTHADGDPTTAPMPLGGVLCDVCKLAPAEYDGKTRIGPWAYMCQADFDVMGVGLGLGRGQRLV